jgi:hypothetical protein
MTRILVAGSIVLLALACAHTTDLGPVTTDSEKVELGAARSAGIEIKMGAGELSINPGDEALLAAEITRNAGLKKPEFNYRVDAERGTLVMRQPSESSSGRLIGTRGYRYRWNLNLSRGVPLDLSIKLGAGTMNLKLAGLQLNQLRVDAGAGTGRFDLSGDWARNVDVAITGGVGSASLKLPSKVGVRVEVDGGLGSVDAYGFHHDGNIYTNDAYGKTAVLMTVYLKAGIGSVNLELDDRK